jgi:hypothetical protein
MAHLHQSFLEEEGDLAKGVFLRAAIYHGNILISSGVRLLFPSLPELNLCSLFLFLSLCLFPGRYSLG